MKYLEGKRVAEILKGTVSEKHQQHHRETDLTVARIYRITGSGSVDFGGSEEEAAPREEVKAEPAAADDKHGWWSLAEGDYVIRFNEVAALSQSQIAFLQPHERLARAGGTHPSFYFREEREFLEVTLHVGSGGLRVKENARVSKLLILELEE